MSDLPPGWAHATLGQLGIYTNGRVFRKSEWSTKGRPIIRIQNITGSSQVFNYYSDDLESRYVVHPGDLLVSWAATLATHIWPGPDEGALNQHIFKVKSYINQRFHKYLLQHLLHRLATQAHGSGIVHLTRRKFESVPVTLPPLPEQDRIVERLEDHLSRVDAAEHQLKRASARAAHLIERISSIEFLCLNTRQTRGIAAHPTAVGIVDGELPNIPDTWKWSRLHEISDIAGGITKDTKRQTDPTSPLVPYLRVANVQRGHLNLDKISYIRAPAAKVDALKLMPGDVLLNEGGDRDKLGRGWIWEGQIPDCIHQNHVFRVRIREGILHPKLLAWHANNFGRSWFDSNGSQSVNLASISLSKLRLFPVPVPPIEEQLALVERIEAYLDSTHQLKATVKTAEDHVTILRASLLAEALSGRFVPQDPNDESASSLLARVDRNASQGPCQHQTGVIQEKLI